MAAAAPRTVRVLAVQVCGQTVLLTVQPDGRVLGWDMVQFLLPPLGQLEQFSLHAVLQRLAEAKDLAQRPPPDT